MKALSDGEAKTISSVKKSAAQHVPRKLHPRNGQVAIRETIDSLEHRPRDRSASLYTRNKSKGKLLNLCWSIIRCCSTLKQPPCFQSTSSHRSECSKDLHRPLIWLLGHPFF